MKNKITQKYYKYMENSSMLRVGVYEAEHLASICGINLPTLVFLGVRANATQAPIQLKTGWYIYSLDERILDGRTRYFISIDNNLKYI